MTFSRILVNIDPLDHEHPALDQAVALAARMQSAITIVDVLPDVPDRARPFVTDRVEQELVDHRWQLLQKMSETRGGGRFGTSVLRGSPAISLVQEVQRGRYDLVIRAHGRAGDLPKAFGPVDMQLLRKCPCPVWLVGPSARPQPRRILAAIDASCNDSGEAALNQSVLDHALAVGDPGGAHVAVLYAWFVFGYDLLQPRLSPKEFTELVASANATAESNLAGAVAALGERRHLVEPVLIQGEPREVIPAYANDHNIDLVVMGTVARTGIAGFVMGNTAEWILNQLRSSVLAIKPAGFVSPVTPDDKNA